MPDLRPDPRLPTFPTFPIAGICYPALPQAPDCRPGLFDRMRRAEDRPVAARSAEKKGFPYMSPGYSNTSVWHVVRAIFGARVRRPGNGHSHALRCLATSLARRGHACYTDLVRFFLHMSRRDQRKVAPATQRRRQESIRGFGMPFPARGVASHTHDTDGISPGSTRVN